MGCNASEMSIVPELIAQTKFGVFKLQIVGLRRQSVQQNSSLQSYLTFKMTNQDFRTHFFGQNNYVSNGQIHSFIVNSRYQLHGRALVVELWEKGVLSDSSKGIGMLDINAILQKRQETRVKIYLNDENLKVGWVQIKCSFDQMPTEVISLMFDSALIRRRTSKVMNCRVKVIVGEETLSTSISEDKEDKTPTWKEDIMVFYTIKDVIKMGKIVVMDGQTEVGGLELNLQVIGQSMENQIQINEEFHYENSIVAGTLRFFIHKGEKRQFRATQTTKSIFVGPKRIGVKLPPLKKQQNNENQLTEEQKQKRAQQQQKKRLQQLKRQQMKKVQQQQKQQTQKKIVDLTKQIEQSKIKAAAVVAQKQKQIDKIKQQYEQQLKKIEKENSAKNSIIQQSLIETQEKLKNKLKQEFEQRTKVIEQQLRLQKQAQITEREKRQVQLTNRIQLLQKQNISLKQVQKTNQIPQIKEKVIHQQHTTKQINSHQENKQIVHILSEETNHIQKQELNHKIQQGHTLIQNTHKNSKSPSLLHIQPKKPEQTKKEQIEIKVKQDKIEKEETKTTNQPILIQPPRIQLQIHEEHSETQIHHPEQTNIKHKQQIPIDLI